jgi:hypothetical protein
MAGDNNLVHSANPAFHHPGALGVPVQLQSFELNAINHHFEFVNMQLVQVPPAAAPNIWFDHQGHIVPQAMMNQVLNPMMIDMNDVCNNADDVNVYIAHAPHNAAWLAPGVTYGLAHGIPMFDFENDVVPNNLANAEMRLGDLFSIVTWNPINICRAPEDIRRNGVPGNTIDTPVRNWLNANPAGVNPQWLAALNALAGAAAPTLDQIRTYLSICTSHLLPTGYYWFNWVPGAGAAGLLPQQ